MRCPYLAHAPETVEGWTAWETLLRASTQLRLGPDGRPYGIDLGVALAMTNACDPEAMSALLTAAEAGLVAGLGNRGDEDG